MPATKSSATTIIARGTSNAAFTQLTGCSVTRSTTTATLTRTSHGRSNGDKVLIQGFSLEEFNGIFTVANAAANTFDYTIAQDPGANPAGTPGTLDLVTLGTAMDMSTAYAAHVFGQLQNGTTGPTLVAQVWVGLSQVNTESAYRWQSISSGSLPANDITPINYTPPQSAAFVNFAVCRNTGQAVDIRVTGGLLTAV